MKPFSIAAVAILLRTIACAAEPALTIYNGGFAVVRDTVALDLKPGANTVRYSGATARLEPDSVILRDPTGKIPLVIHEQNYRNDPASQSFLLSLFEGKQIDFEIVHGDKKEIVPGRIIRSGHNAVEPGEEAERGDQHAPIIEVGGHIRFDLPGTPLFPSLGDDTILQPTLIWDLQSAGAAKVDAELAYVTEGFNWKADYNLVAPEKGDAADLAGWVTVSNESGKTFTNARLKLMAGEVHKIARPGKAAMRSMAVSDAEVAEEAQVEEKAFDEYHLYTLPRPTTLRDRETKQVEFTRATNVKTQRIHSFDATGPIHIMRNGFNPDPEPPFGGKPKVVTQLELKNTAENHLGIPLPAGRLRVYRRDGEQLEFVGEDNIEHTPRDETVRVTIGAAFDLVGERKQTNFESDEGRRQADESFAIELRNRSTNAATIKVIEHLYRGPGWKITEKSHPFTKKDAQTIEFLIPLKPDETATVTYTVHYAW